MASPAEMQPMSLDDIPMVENDADEVTYTNQVVTTLGSDEVQNDNALVPTVGMSFRSEDEVKKFYKLYAIQSGFGVRIRTSKKDIQNQVRYLKIVCSREGNHVSAIPHEIKTLRTQRNQCPARITVLRREGQWFITGVVDKHNHDISPTKSRLIRGNRNINMHVKRTLEINDEAGVRINKSFRSLVCDAGDFENLECLERDVRNYIGVQRRALGKDGDGVALLNHFSHMRELNDEFFYEIDMDEENRITNVFWADARSRATCYDFGDIVSFDTTYITNKYDMPFAPFVGVNHHGHSMLLGCGLLSKEDTTTFVWLFSSWLRCMRNRGPDGIVTDQCKAMQNAIETVFPNTRHRWCLWHIMKKIPKKLVGYSNYHGIKLALKHLLYESTDGRVLNKDGGISYPLIPYKTMNGF